jgi:hypothetical protein
VAAEGEVCAADSLPLYQDRTPASGRITGNDRLQHDEIEENFEKKQKTRKARKTINSMVAGTAALSRRFPV